MMVGTVKISTAAMAPLSGTSNASKPKKAIWCSVAILIALMGRKLENSHPPVYPRRWSLHLTAGLDLFVHPGLAIRIDWFCAEDSDENRAPIPSASVG